MKKKYQKPVTRNLGDLAVAEGTCVVGIGVRAAHCAVGSEHYLCNVGTRELLPNCTNGASATTACINYGLSALE